MLDVLEVDNAMRIMRPSLNIQGRRSCRLTLRLGMDESRVSGTLVLDHQLGASFG